MTQNGDRASWTSLDAATRAAYSELAVWIAQLRQSRPCPVFGLCGAQGSGKSTAAAFLQSELATAHGLRAAVLSLDDFYLPRVARQAMAAQVHPLFATRGVPGTHDVELGLDRLQALREVSRGECLDLPRFSKARDDRLPAEDWCRVEGPFDLVLFEGWCVGLPPQPDSDLAQPVNELEAQEDRAGAWRRAVNDALAGPYANWFARLDVRIFLRVPDLGCVRRWRGQQERDTARSAGGAGSALQSPAQLERFIQHYERLTIHALRVMPGLAQAVLELNARHAVRELRFVKA